MAAFLDVVNFLPVSSGTVDFVVASAVQGFQTPASAGVVNGRTYKYRAESADLSQWEVGEGTYNTGTNTLTRAIVLYNSLGTTAKINFSTIPQVGIVALKSDLISISEANSFTDAQKAQARTNVYAAPFDAMAYSGLQLNGAMEISQQYGFNTPTVLTATGALQQKYALDGVLMEYRGSFVAEAKQYWGPLTAGLPAIFCCQVNVTTAQASLGANDELSIVLPIEGSRWTNSLLYSVAQAMPVSIGFWFMAHRAGTYSGSIRNASRGKSYPFSFTIAAADTPQWISLTNIPGETTNSIWDTATGVGAYVAICLAGGTSRVGTGSAWASANYSGVSGTTNGVAATSDVFYLSSVMIVPGIELPQGSKTPYIMRDAIKEMPLAQRYFYNGEPLGRGMVYATNICDRMACRHPATMRAAPSLNMVSPLSVYDGTAYGPATSINGNTSSKDFFEAGLVMSLSTYTVGRPCGIYAGAGGNMEVNARFF